MTRTVGITGSSGYLGAVLMRSFAAAGWQTVGLARSPSGPGDRRFELGAAVDPATLEGLDVVVHAAYDLTLVSRRDIWSTNVRGTELLLEAATAAGVGRVIVLSSMSAYTGTRQLYGQAKLEIERLTTEHDGVIVRPGIVIGDASGGMAGSLTKLLVFPIAPTIAGAGLQFPVAEEDFAAAILTLAEAPEVPRLPLGVAQETPVSFDTLLRAIARRSGRHVRLFVPVPWPAVYWALRLGERLGVRLPFRSDSLLGLLRPAPFVPGTAALKALGLEPRAVTA